MSFSIRCHQAQTESDCALRPDHVHLHLVEAPRKERGWSIAAVGDFTPFRNDLVQLLPRLRRFALTLTQNRADGDDLVQATCERAMLRAAQWQIGTRLDSWIYTMMRNIWVSEIRSRRVRIGQGQVDASETDELATHVGAADHIYGNQLIGMVLSMPEGLSATLLLVSVEGHSYQEAATILDIPIGTVMSRMSRARGMMKEMLGGATVG